MQRENIDNRRGVLNAPETGAGASVPPAPPKPPAPPLPPKPSAVPRPTTTGLRPDQSSNGGGLSGLRVSLMPVDESEGKPDLRKRLLILIIVLIAETLLIGGTYVVLDQRTRSQQAELEDLRKQESQLGSAIKQQEADADELAAFAIQISAISKHLDDHVYWTNVFTLLEQYTKSTVRYENFAAGLSGRVVTLSAIAPTYRDMAEQILAFRSVSLIRNVRADAGISEIDERGRLSGVKWNMVLDLAPDVWKLEAKDKVKNPDALAVTPEPIITTSASGKPVPSPTR